jgi:hypothetical protein
MVGFTTTVADVRETTLVAPGWGTPSKKKFNHFCSVSVRHPAIKTKPQINPAIAARMRSLRQPLFFGRNIKFIDSQ